MKAIVLSKTSKPELQELEDVVLDRDDWVKIRVKAVGLCGSDMQKINSSKPPEKYLKTRILGHEFSGEISELGKKVESLDLEQRVTAIPLIPCYICLPCKEEAYQLCENIKSVGRNLPGAFSEQVLVPAKNVRKISDTTSYETACFSDVVAVVVHNYHIANSPMGKRVLIFGDGAVGLTCLQIYAKDNHVDVVGKHNESKVGLLGGGYTHISDVKDLHDNSYVIIAETVGRNQNQTLREAIRLIKPQGKIVVAGVYESGFVGKMIFRDLFYKEATLQGSNSYGVWNGENEFDIALRMVEEEEINT